MVLIPFTLLLMVTLCGLSHKIILPSTLFTALVEYEQRGRNLGGLCVYVTFVEQGSSLGYGMSSTLTRYMMQVLLR